jgi:segregation and condensation protein A
MSDASEAPDPGDPAADAVDLGASYPVSLSVFTGPLDLLLQLIERHELEISAVSLVAVTDQYLRTLETLDVVDPGALADFLAVASRLLLIKSRALLPQPRQIDEGEEEDEESADALVRRLLEYRQFKDVAGALRSREEEGLRAYVRIADQPALERRLDYSGLHVDQLYRAFKRVLDRMPGNSPLPRVRTYTVTVAEQIEYVRDRLKAALEVDGGEPIRFTALLSAQTSRLEVIVTFLAILELIKQQEITAVQDEAFGEIMLVPGGGE